METSCQTPSHMSFKSSPFSDPWCSLAMGISIFVAFVLGFLLENSATTIDRIHILGWTTGGMVVGFVWYELFHPVPCFRLRYPKVFRFLKLTWLVILLVGIIL